MSSHSDIGSWTCPLKALTKRPIETRANTARRKGTRPLPPSSPTAVDTEAWTDSGRVTSTARTHTTAWVTSTRLRWPHTIRPVTTLRKPASMWPSRVYIRRLPTYVWFCRTWPWAAKAPGSAARLLTVSSAITGVSGTGRGVPQRGQNCAPGRQALPQERQSAWDAVLVMGPPGAPADGRGSRVGDEHVADRGAVEALGTRGGRP